MDFEALVMEPMELGFIEEQVTMAMAMMKAITKAALENFVQVIAVEVVATLLELLMHLELELVLAATVMVMAAEQEPVDFKVIMMIKDLAIIELAEAVKMELIIAIEAKEPMERLQQAIAARAMVTTIPADSEEEIAKGLLVS